MATTTKEEPCAHLVIHCRYMSNWNVYPMLTTHMHGSSLNNGQKLGTNQMYVKRCINYSLAIPKNSNTDNDNEHPKPNAELKETDTREQTYLWFYSREIQMNPVSNIGVEVSPGEWWLEKIQEALLWYWGSDYWSPHWLAIWVSLVWKFIKLTSFKCIILYVLYFSGNLKRGHKKAKKEQLIKMRIVNKGIY